MFALKIIAFITGYNGRTPLMSAAINGNTEEVERLIKTGVDVNQKDWFGNTALYFAAARGYPEIVKLVIAAGADVNKANYRGTTAIIRAAFRADTETLKLLLENGVQVDKADNDGKTALIWAAIEGDEEVEFVELLIKEGANINKANNKGRTALMCAAKAGNIEILKLLLENGAEVDKVDNNGCTALMRAALYQNIECVNLIKTASIAWKKVIGHLSDEETRFFNGLNYNKEFAEKCLQGRLEQIAWKQLTDQDLSIEEAIFSESESYNQDLAKDFLQARANKITAKITRNIKLTNEEDIFLNNSLFHELDDTFAKDVYENVDLTSELISPGVPTDAMVSILDFLPKKEVFKILTNFIVSNLKKHLTSYKIEVAGEQRSLSLEERSIVGLDRKKMIQLSKLISQNSNEPIAFQEGETINLNTLLNKLAPFEVSSDEDLSIEALPNEASFQFSPQGQYFAGTLTGTFLVNPAIRYFKDQINGKNENKFFIQYYSEMLTPDALSHFTVALIVPITNKVMSAYLGISEYTLSGNHYLPNFAVAITDSPFVQGLLQSTIIEGVMLAVDGMTLLGETLYCKIYNCHNPDIA